MPFGSRHTVQINNIRKGRGDAIGAHIRCNRGDFPEIDFIGSVYMESNVVNTTERSFGMPSGSNHDIFTINQTGGEQLSVASTSANDTSAGTGLRTITMYGLDSNFLPISETMTLNGQTEVNTTSSDWLRVNKIWGETAGSGGVNAGDIYVGQVGDFTAGKPTTITYMAVIAGFNNSTAGVYTVPAGKTFEYTRGNTYTDASGSKPMIIRETGWFNGGNQPDPLQYLQYQVGALGSSGNVSYDFSGAAGYPEKSTLDLRVKSTTGTLNTAVLYYEYILCDNAKKN